MSMNQTDKHKEKKLRPFSIFRRRTSERSFILSVLLLTAQMVVVLLVCTALAVGGALLGIGKAYYETTPTLDIEILEETNLTSFIYDRYGNIITDYKGIENREIAKISEIPMQLQNAFIAIEDARFREHNGVDVKGLIRAFAKNVSGGSVQGGSTITQQLVKMRLLTSEQSYKRKIQEAYLALALELKYDKDRILELYLNTIPLGEGNYGVKVAAKDYFGKELHELTLRESAMLAGITRNPFQNSPRRNYIKMETPEKTDVRTDLVLRNMYEYDMIDRTQYESALREKVTVLPEATTKEQGTIYKNAFYVEYAISQLVTHMLTQENIEVTSANRTMMENRLRTGGYHIYLALDTTAQTIMENTVLEWKNWPKLRDPSKSISKEPNGDGTYTDVIQPQVSASVVDHLNGELIAIMGGRTLPQRRKELNRAFQAFMPVGSSIKPLAVYGPALDLGASPASIVYNMPVQIPGWGAKGYPNNYGGGGFKGAETLREALRRSHNTAAAQALENLVGIDNAYGYLLKFGINPKYLMKDGPGFALGSSGITTIEMATAFGTIAHMGEYQEALAYLKVIDANGKVIIDGKEYQKQHRRQVFKPSTAWMLTGMLEEAVNSGTGTNARMKNMPVAGKTGTNSEFRGVSFAGFTPYLSGSVWIGHDRNSPLSSITGGTASAPLFKEIMTRLHAYYNYENKPLMDATPESLGLVKVTLCGVSGMIATTACSSDSSGSRPSTDWILDSEKEKLQKCNMHFKGQICTLGRVVPGLYCPEEAIIEASIFMIPESGHPLSKADKNVVHKYLPGAIWGTLKNSTPSRKSDCPIHTKEWYDSYMASSGVITQAKALIASVQQKMAVAGPNLSAANKKLLDEAILALQAAFITSPVNESRIVTLMNKLQALADTIFPPDPTPVPETVSPTPEMNTPEPPPVEPEPTPAPTPSPEPTPEPELT